MVGPGSERDAPGAAESPEELRRAVAERRAAVYRAGATAADVAALQAALEHLYAAEAPSRAEARATPPESEVDDAAPVRPDGAAEQDVDRGPAVQSIRRGVRPLPLVVGAAAVLIAVAGGTTWARQAVEAGRAPGTRATPVPSPPRSTPIPFPGGAPLVRAQQQDLAALFDGRRDPRLSDYLLRHRIRRPDEIGLDYAFVIGAGTGSRSFDLAELAAVRPAGRLTLYFTCDRDAAYRWTFSSEGRDHDDPTSLSSTGRNCAGHVLSTRLTPTRASMPTRLRLEVPRGVRTIVEVDVAQPATPP